MSSMTAVTTRTQAAHLWAIQVDSLSRQLPLDMILNILSKMSPRCLATISSTCKCYIALSKVDFVWTSLFHEHFPHPLTNDIHSKEIYPLEAYKREFTVNQNLMKGAFTWHHLGTHSQGGPVSIDIVGDQYISICEFDEIRYGNIKSNAKAKEKQFETQGSTCRIVADDKILVGYNEGKIEVWSSVPESPELQLTLTGHTGRVLGILFENDRLYSYSADQTIKIWNVTSGGCVATLKDVDETLESLAVKDGIIVMGTFEGEIKIWNPKALNSIITLPSRNDGEKLLALAIGDGTVYVSYSDKTIKAWKIEEKSSSLFAKCSESVFSLSIAGDKLISENGMGTILVWD